jgi:hypothetical protein
MILFKKDVDSDISNLNYKNNKHITVVVEGLISTQPWLESYLQLVKKISTQHIVNAIELSIILSKN